MTSTAILDNLVTVSQGRMHVTYTLTKLASRDYLWESRATICFPNRWDSTINEYCNAYYYFIGNPATQQHVTQQSAASKAIKWLADQGRQLDRGPWYQENEATGQYNDLSQEDVFINAQGDCSWRDGSRAAVAPGPSLNTPTDIWAFGDAGHTEENTRHVRPPYGGRPEETREAAWSQVVTNIADVILQALNPPVFQSNPAMEAVCQEHRIKLCQLLEKSDFQQFVRNYYSANLRVSGCDWTFTVDME